MNYLRLLSVALMLPILTLFVHAASEQEHPFLPPGWSPEDTIEGGPIIPIVIAYTGDTWDGNYEILQRFCTEEGVISDDSSGLVCNRFTDCPKNTSAIYCDGYIILSDQF